MTVVAFCVYCFFQHRLQVSFGALAKMASGGPYSLVASRPGYTLTRTDILVGEVWPTLSSDVDRYCELWADMISLPQCFKCSCQRWAKQRCSIERLQSFASVSHMAQLQITSPEISSCRCGWSRGNQTWSMPSETC